MTQVGERPVAFAVVAAVLLIATVTDLRERRVPWWLTLPGIAGGLAWAAVSRWVGELPELPTTGIDIDVFGGYAHLQESGLGLLTGLLILSPFVLLGRVTGRTWVGLGDVLLLGVIGAWHGWIFVLWCTWWMSLVGALLALIALARKQRAFPYVPALLLGFIAATFLSSGGGSGSAA